jgi:DNA-binding IclR family transcriptional regulator
LERESWQVTRTLRALEALALGPHSALDLADALLIHPRTARRMLDRFVHEGFATRTRDPPRKYVATLRLVALAGQVVQNTEVVQAAQGYLSRLAEETGLVAHLSVPSLLSVVCVLHAEARRQKPVPSLGERIPAHATAAGKTLLAFRDGWRSSVLQQALEPFTALTVTERALLEAELCRTRTRGYAVEDGEYRDDQAGIAVPVFSHTCEAVAALGISGPRDRVTRGSRRSLASVVTEAAATVSHDIGYGAERSQDRSAHDSAARLHLVP